MVQINFAKREVQCKVVYYGPARSGKTTNLRSIHERSPERVRGQLTTIATDTNRTLFFDFLPLDLGDLAGIHTKVHLYAIPYITGQNAMRVLVLEGADGIVFVADAAPHRLERNREAYENLRENLAQLGRDLADIPVVWQWNKTDLPDAMNDADLCRELNPKGQPAFPAAAEAGTGVFTTLKAMTRAVLADVSKMMVPASEVAQREAAAPAPAATPEPDDPPAPALVPIAMPVPEPPTRAPAAAPELPPLRPAQPLPAVAAAEGPSPPKLAPLPSLPPVPEPAPAAAFLDAAPTEADPDTESRPFAEKVPVPAPPAAPEPLPDEPAAEEPPAYVPPWRRSAEAAFASEPEPEDTPTGALEFSLDPEPEPAEEEEYPAAVFADFASVETDPDPRTAGQPRGIRPAPEPVGEDHWDTPARTAPLPTVPSEAYREPAYAEPEYEPEYEEPSRRAYAAPEGERFVSVGGESMTSPHVIHGWDEPRRPRPRRRLSREARPVIDRRKAPRADETLQAVPVSHLAVGAAFGLFSLIAIGYLVHVLL